MVSYLRSSDCTIIYEFPHVVSRRVRQVDDMLSVSRKDVELNVQERQVVSVNDLRPLSVVNHIPKMSWILSTSTMQKFLNRSFWVSRWKTARQYAPITDSNRPKITPQKNSLIRTAVVMCGDCGSAINPMMLPSRQITRTATSNGVTIQSPTLGNLPNFSDIGSRTKSPLLGRARTNSLAAV